MSDQEKDELMRRAQELTEALPDEGDPEMAHRLARYSIALEAMRPRSPRRRRRPTAESAV